MPIPPGLLLSDDLIFTSRIVGEARAQSLDLKSARTIAELSKLTTADPPACFLVDLNHPELNIEELAQTWKARGAFLVGYGSHVDAETLRRARQAGFDVVLPRSKFVEGLDAALPRWFGAV